MTEHINLHTTLRLLRKHSACKPGYETLTAALGPDWGDNDPITLERIVETNGLQDAIWALCAVPKSQAKYRDRLARLFAVWCARQVLHIYEESYPDDKRPRNAIDTAERFALGQATENELAARTAAWASAGDAARAAAWASAGDAVRAAENAARASAGDAVRAAENAARASAGDAVRAAEDAARAAAWTTSWAAAWAAVRDAARDAAWAAQKEQFLKMLRGKSYG